MAGSIYWNLDSECYFGRHKFEAGKCTRPGCNVDQNNLVAIEGRRWFSTAYGNTYHSVTVWMPNGTKLRAPYAYGYGEQYMDTALALIAQHFGDGLRDGERLLAYLATKGYWANPRVEDVPRKRDL